MLETAGNAVGQSGHLQEKKGGKGIIGANISVLVGIDTPSFRTLYGEILEGFVRGMHLTSLKPGWLIRSREYNRVIFNGYP